MTRFARGQAKTRPSGEEATPWQELSHGVKQEPKKKPQTTRRTPNPGERAAMQKRLQREQRGEQRRLKRVNVREQQKTCFNCRGTGHVMSECPGTRSKGRQQEGGAMCFKCGSLEHGVAACRAKVGKDEFPYAKCFICGEQGHLSRSCPDNPRGLYPNGGCCKICSSVEHFAKDCPENINLHPRQPIVRLKIDTSRSIEDLDVWEEETFQEGGEKKEEEEEKKREELASWTFGKKKKPKVVVF